MSHVQSRLALEQIVPRHDQLKCEFRVYFLIARRGVLDVRDDWLKLFFGLFELLVRFYDLLERHDLFFRVSRFVESGDQLVSLRYAFAADLDRITLFCGN